MKSTLVATIIAVNGRKTHEKSGTKKVSDSSLTKLIGTERKQITVNQCESRTIDAEGGSFKSINNGCRGEIKLERASEWPSAWSDYPGTLHQCKYVVQAADDCNEINIHFRDIAIPCDESSFWFEWTENNTPKVSEEKCHCKGDGCLSHGVSEMFYDKEPCWYLEYYPEYYPDGVNDEGLTLETCTDYYQDSYNFVDWKAYWHLGSLDSLDEGLSIKSNKFEFHFELLKYGFLQGGHINLEWECVSPTTLSCQQNVSTTTLPR